jgi:hypothetical protein
VVKVWLAQTFHAAVIARRPAEVLIDKTGPDIACINADLPAVWTAATSGGNFPSLLPGGGWLKVTPGSRNQNHERSPP